MSTSDRPNIIVIMTDQQRLDTINALGFNYMISPGMDRLVRNGISFNRAFACGATCIASRAAMFTGMFNHNTGVYSFNQWAHQRLWVHDLRDAGYHCVSIGKMHLAPRDDPSAFHERVIVENPTNLALRGTGVDDDWGRYLHVHGVTRPNDRETTDPDWRKKFQAVPWHLEEHLHSDVFIGNSALGWIDRYPQERGKPIFLQIGFVGPHEPYDPLPRLLDLYDDVDIPDAVKREGEFDEKPPQHKAHQRFFDNHMREAQINMPEATPEDIRNMRRHYYAKITTVDEQVGKVLEALEEKGYLDNAVVFFTSDHGDMVGDHQMAYKWLMYDSIVNIPFIIWDTRKDTQGTVTHDLVSQIDIGPTVLEAAGVPIPKYLEGQSLMGYFEEDKPEPHKAVFCEDNYETMARTKDWKLVYYTHQENDGELYDLNADPDELHNLFHDPAYKDKRLEMQQILAEWLLRSNYKTAGYKTGQFNLRSSTPTEAPYLIAGWKNIPALRKLQEQKE